MNQKPTLLLADSQLLFWQKNNTSFLQQFFPAGFSGKAAYIGVANNDRPEFYQIFTAAMKIFPELECRQITRNFSSQEQQFLAEADLILLAGGDVLLGWQIMEQSGMAKMIVERYYKGAYLVGVSAGAIHLGLAFLNDRNALQNLSKCLPFVIDVHQEETNWQRLKQSLELLNNPYVLGIGIPLGAGVIYHSDHALEAVHKPAWLFRLKEGALERQLLLVNTSNSREKVRENG